MFCDFACIKSVSRRICSKNGAHRQTCCRNCGKRRKQKPCPVQQKVHSQKLPSAEAPAAACRQDQAHIFHYVSCAFRRSGNPHTRPHTTDEIPTHDRYNGRFSCRSCKPADMSARYATWLSDIPYSVSPLHTEAHRLLQVYHKPHSTVKHRYQFIEFFCARE